MNFRGVYPILDVPSPSAIQPAKNLADQLLETDISLIQLRAKGLPDAQFLNLAKILVNIFRAKGFKTIINNRADIAAISGAQGVHLGSEDISIEEARTLLPKDSIIGISVDTPDEARVAASSGATYVSWGSVFPTLTKQDAVPQEGPIGLTHVRAAIPTEIPLVAIGGIGLENIGQVAQFGADAAAIIGALQNNNDPAKMINKLQTAFDIGRRQHKSQKAS